MWPEAETPLSLSLRPFSLGVSRWLSVLPALLRWLTSLLSPPLLPVTHGQRFVDMFGKHKQLGLHRIWACSGEGGDEFTVGLLLFVRGSGGTAGWTERKLLFGVWSRGQRV